MGSRSEVYFVLFQPTSRKRPHLRERKVPKMANRRAHSVDQPDGRPEDEDGRHDDSHALHGVADGEGEGGDLVKGHVGDLVVEVVEHALCDNPPAEYRGAYRENTEVRLTKKKRELKKKRERRKGERGGGGKGGKRGKFKRTDYTRSCLFLDKRRPGYLSLQRCQASPLTRRSGGRCRKWPSPSRSATCPGLLA